MPLSIERKRAIAVYGAIIILFAAGAVIIIENPDVSFFPEKEKLQITSLKKIAGRNESDVNLSITIEIKNIGNSNESKTLVCSVRFLNGTNEEGNENRTLITLMPGETRTYYIVVKLPDSAIPVNWNLKTVFED
jgi:hypothetical protein